jgi:hypothetical protein
MSPPAAGEMTPPEARALSAPVVGDWATRVAGHHYSLGVISSALTLVLECGNSLRSTGAVIRLLSGLLVGDDSAPSYVSVRLWMLRVGLYELTRPKEQADDWIWIIDHTMQIGEAKCLIIVGIRQAVFETLKDRRLQHEDVTLIDVQPVVTSTGEVVARQLNDAVEKTGTPRAIVSDNGRDLRRGLDLFCREHPSTDWVYDIKHYTANLLKKELQNDATWKSFVAQANLTKKRTYLTPLAFLAPPGQRSKARYMNADVLIDWGGKALRFLEDLEVAAAHDLDPAALEGKLGWLRMFRQPLSNWQEMMTVIGVAENYVRHEGLHSGAAAELAQRLEVVVGAPLSRQFRDRLVAFVEEQSALVHDDERLLGSSEVLESIIGKYKRLQGNQSQHGLTPMILSLGAFIGNKTISFVKQSLETISVRKLYAWTNDHLGTTVQSHRKQAFSQLRKRTEMEPKPSTNV